MSKLPIAKPPANLRQRARADGSVRIWWEPSSAARNLGFEPVELDAKRLTWSVREADRLNRDLDRAKATGRRAAPAPSGRSIEALIEKFSRSDKHARLAPKTRESYAKQFALIAAKWGQYQTNDFSKPIMHEWYETLLAQTSETTAIARLRHFSILMSYAELIGWRAENSNPCTRLSMRVPRGRRRVVSWPELDALCEAARDLGLASIETALVISFYTGQRQTDIRMARLGHIVRQPVRFMGWPAPREVWIWRLTRSKRGNTSDLLIHDDAAPILEAAIEAAKTRLRAAAPGVPLTADAIDAAPLLTDELAGIPFEGRGAEDRFQNRLSSVKARAIAMAKEAGDHALAAALPEIQFRDLRRSFGVHSRAAGASKDDTADVLGNSSATNQLLGDIYMAPSIESTGRAVTALRRPEKKQA